MDSSNQLTNVVLFPLCDVHGVLMDTLCATTDSPNTRTDALVFAWRLGLPKGMDISHAAEALLVVALRSPRKTWTAQQLLIVRELMALAGRTEFLPSVKHVKNKAASTVSPKRRARDVSIDADELFAARERSMTRELSKGRDDVKSAQMPARHSSTLRASKESKKWWKLVGRDPSS